MSLRRALLFRLLGPVALLLILSSALAYRLTLHYSNAIYDSWLYDIAHTVSLEVGEDGPEVVHVDEVEQQLKTWKTGDHEYYSISVGDRIIAGEKDLPAATGTPAAAIERISAEIEQIAKTPETIQVLANAGIDAVGGKPADYGRAILDENDRLAKAIRVAGVKGE